MYRNKRDVDKHVESLLSKLSPREFKTRAYSVARLYFEVGDYASCQKYVEQYLTQKDNNAAAHKLLGQAFQKLGQKEKALEHFKTTLDIDPNQTTTILDICELLADSVIDVGRARYWCEKAVATFPRHPVTFRLRERIMSVTDPNPDALKSLLKSELALRPKDVQLHTRLLKHYIDRNEIQVAFSHSCDIEFSGKPFINNFSWYETLSEVLSYNSENIKDWLYQQLLLTVKERVCVLSLMETPSGLSKSLVESSDLLFAYDQAIETVAKAGATPGHAELHSSLLQHHRGQLVFHAATFLLKKAKKDQLSWRDATKLSTPLMLIASQIVPINTDMPWLENAPDKQKAIANRWHTEGSYRCSQSGHYILSNVQENKNQTFLAKIAESFSSSNWRDKFYEKIFTNKDHQSKMKTSYFASNAYNAPDLRLPRWSEVEAYDVIAQREFATSLHHFVWTLSNYKNYAHFKCSLFDMLTPTITNCGPESLNKLDVYAFLYSATLSASQRKPNESSMYTSTDKPNVIPANISDLLCPLLQMKWWDCAYKFAQNELGTELTDIRATLSRGIEVVRCVDNHGIDPELLCKIGRIFSEKAKLTTAVDEKNNCQIRAGLYYSSAIPLLEKLKSKVIVKVPEKRMFDYTHGNITSRELNFLIEESKVYVAVNHIYDCEYEKAIELLCNLKSPQALFHLGQAYLRLAQEDCNLSIDDTEFKLKYASLLSKAKGVAHRALEKLKENEVNRNINLFSEIQELIDDIETRVNKIDMDISDFKIIDGKFNSDEYVSLNGNEQTVSRTHSVFRNLSSTPKQPSNNMSNYRTAVDSKILESSRVDQQGLDRIENQIKNLQKRDCTINDFMEQTKHWFEENQNLGKQIISTIHSNIQNTTDQFKLLKVSVDEVKGQIDECRNDCKDVGDLKKQIELLKKELNKLKKSTPEQVVDDTDLYNLDDDYRSNTGASNLPSQMPFPSPQVMSSINQRLIPQFPLPYNLYGQNLYNLYNQYSQFSQPPPMPGAQPIFDPTRGQINFQGVFPTPDQMYLDVAHLLPPNLPPATVAPTIPSVPTVVPPVPTVPAVSVPQSAKTCSKQIVNAESMKVLPVNVVITSSDPLPTCTTTPAPILSVTIPPKHIKNTPHNYQIALPPSDDTKVTTPVFSFANTSPMANWKQSPIFKMSQPITSETNERSVTNGSFTGGSPNISLNKSRTMSEKSNTSIENYDPCPDFKPIIPLPAEVKVTTGEEDETAIFSARSKLFRFVDKQWKDRGIGEMKLLKHKVTGKVRVLMRREQVHKICANHIITSEMDIQPMKNESKAYIWVANDFADEVLVLEKFCIKFKTPEIALEFYNTFEKARQEATSHNVSTSWEPGKKEISTPIKSPSTEPTKTVVGGFTFSSTPTFKPVSETVNISKPDPTETTTSKVNIFSNLAFKTTNSAPFSSILNTSPALLNELNKETATAITKEFNNSDTVEEYEPNVEFKPVIPLPALVQQKTGEEDENILFEHRAKLLRFDVSSKEWKERGLGNIKLLAQKENPQKIRLLMRREQIMKVCCNHTVTKDMIFQKMTNMDKAVTWCAKDFSDGELVSETFCLRFKTVSDCDKFIDALKSAQSKMKDDSKAAKEEQNAAKQNNQLGFGDAFKPKPGAWNCQACYTNNLESFTKCACCEQPNPNNVNTSTSNTTFSGWGDTFKAKPGSWECKECYIRNESSSDKCNACNSLRNLTADKLENKTVPTTNFSFGIPSKSEPVVKSPALTGSSSSGWGGLFKPKEGTWECMECFVRNEGSADECSACNNPKDPNAKKSSKSLFDSHSSGPKFNFGIPAKETGQKSEPLSIFGSASVQKFSFGIPTNVNSDQNTASFPNLKQETPVKSIEFNNDTPVNFSLKKDEAKEQSSVFSSSQKNSLDATLSGGSSFDFKFKPKSPSKGKSPRKSPHGQNGTDSDDNEYASEDEGAHLQFTPVVPLPDKIEVLTGEESEDELYGHRAKLFIFVTGEWKERGIGIVKVLKHKNTGKLRVVMRREQVLKICLNHTLTKDIIYKPKDEKNWIFAANDFSEGELTLQKFCLRFKNKEIATDFKNAVDNALGVETSKINAKEQSEGDEVVFVSEIQATNEEKKMAKELMLPENFFNYKNKEPCNGCRGCKDDADDTLKTARVSLASSIFTSAVSTPVKNSPLTFQSPANSFYGTPANFDKTADTAMFRTPLGSIGANIESATRSTNNSSANENDLTDKENTLQESSGFLGLGEQKTLFGTSQNFSNISGSGDTEAKSSILAAPKLSSLNLSSGEKHVSIFGENQAKTIFGGSKPSFGQSTETKSVFGNSGENKSLFGLPNPNSGLSTNKSIFSFSVEDEQEDNGNTETLFGLEKPEIKSIFNNGDQKPVNLFSGGTQGSLFGPGSLTKDQSTPTSGVFGSSQGSLFGVSSLSKDQSKPKSDVFGSSLFGSGTSQLQFGNGNSFFGNSNKPSWSFSTNADQKPDVVGNKKDDEKNIGKPEFLAKIDNTLSFAELSAGGPGFRTAENFKWEGAGQQLFGVGQQANKDNSATDVTGDEEYDPHYEPIVPLPDKIVVTTGEEDEEKVFGERGKLYRYDEKTREWKERGVGEMKVLYHPERKSYRMLLRREQIHKAVLNMLLFMDLELLPMKNSDRAWTWAGRNFAETPAGEQETLAVRFKSVELATAFQTAVTDCVRKLQVAAAQAIREEKEGTSKVFGNVAPLRLPKHLENSARADEQINATVTFQTQLSIDKSENQNGASKTSPAEVFKQVQFVKHEDNDDGDEEEYDDDDYYNEDNNDGGLHYECDGVSVVTTHNGAHAPCDNAQVQVMFDQEICSPKILVTDSDTGEILADMLIYTETEFQLSGVSCTWAGTDYTTNDPLDKTVTITFPDDDAALEFYDSCETSKAAAYSSTDPES